MVTKCGKGETTVDQWSTVLTIARVLRAQGKTIALYWARRYTYPGRPNILAAPPSLPCPAQRVPVRY